MNNLSTEPFLFQDGVERDLVAEINAKTKLPITKQVNFLSSTYLKKHQIGKNCTEHQIAGLLWTRHLPWSSQKERQER